MRGWFTLAGILAAIAAVPAFAQAGGESRIPTWKQSYLVEGTFDSRVLRAIGFCAVDGRRPIVEKLLATRAYSDQEAEAFDELFKPPLHECLAGDWSFRVNVGPVIRGVVAEYLYKKRGWRPRADALAPPPDFESWAAANVALPAFASPKIRDLVFGSWVARCIVARNPRKAHQLVNFESGSPGETRSLAALRPDFLACVPEGKSLQVSRRTIRYAIAEALYHASQAEADRVGQRTAALEAAE